MACTSGATARGGVQVWWDAGGEALCPHCCPLRHPATQVQSSSHYIFLQPLRRKPNYCNELIAAGIKGTLLADVSPQVSNKLVLLGRWVGAWSISNWPIYCETISNFLTRRRYVLKGSITLTLTTFPLFVCVGVWGCVGGVCVCVYIYTGMYIYISTYIVRGL